MLAHSQSVPPRRSQEVDDEAETEEIEQQFSNDEDEEDEAILRDQGEEEEDREERGYAAMQERPPSSDRTTTPGKALRLSTFPVLSLSSVSFLLAFLLLASEHSCHLHLWCVLFQPDNAVPARALWNSRLVPLRRLFPPLLPSLPHAVLPPIPYQLRHMLLLLLRLKRPPGRPCALPVRRK